MRIFISAWFIEGSWRSCRCLSLGRCVSKGGACMPWTVIQQLETRVRPRVHISTQENEDKYNDYNEIYSAALFILSCDTCRQNNTTFFFKLSGRHVTHMMGLLNWSFNFSIHFPFPSWPFPSFSHLCLVYSGCICKYQYKLTTNICPHCSHAAMKNKTYLTRVWNEPSTQEHSGSFGLGWCWRIYNL